MTNDSPEFNEGDHVKITYGPYTDIVGKVSSRINEVYYVVPDLNRRVILPVSLEYLELIPEPTKVDPLKIGMSSEDLADYVDQFIREAQARVLGTGNDQYSEGTHQRFEGMELDELLRWTQEEVQDIAVYSAMLDIRLRRIREALKAHL